MSNSIIHCVPDETYGSCPYCDGRACRACQIDIWPLKCAHDTIERHLQSHEQHKAVTLVRPSYKHREVHNLEGAEAMTQGQTLGKSPKSSSNVKIETSAEYIEEVGQNQQGYTFSLCLHGEWFRSHKFYKSRLDAETAAFRVSRKLNITLRGL